VSYWQNLQRLVLCAVLALVSVGTTAVAGAQSSSKEKPAATDVGIRSIKRNRGASAEVSRIIKPTAIKTPTALGISRLVADAAINAAPGVDQAVISGSR